jgi:hypothetical protein
MASTFKSTKVATTIPAKSGIGVTCITATYALTTNLIINDVIQVCTIPAGATILDATVATPDVDSATSLVWDLGDGDTTGRFISSSTVGQAAGVARLSVVGGLGYKYTAEDTIDYKVTTAPGTGVTSGTIRFMVLYTLDE